MRVKTNTHTTQHKTTHAHTHVHSQTHTHTLTGVTGVWCVGGTGKEAFFVFVEEESALHVLYNICTVILHDIVLQYIHVSVYIHAHIHTCTYILLYSSTHSSTSTKQQVTIVQ